MKSRKLTFTMTSHRRRRWGATNFWSSSSLASGRGPPFSSPWCWPPARRGALERLEFTTTIWNWRRRTKKTMSQEWAARPAYLTSWRILKSLVRTFINFFLIIHRESGCTPLSASLIADRFSHRSRAFAMSLYTWGIYVGYGLAFLIGIYITELNVLNQAS